MNTNTIFYLILILIAFFILRKFADRFKVPKIGSLSIFTGGVKCGKSSLAVATALTQYKRSLRSVKIKNFFRVLFRKNKLELPLLYSNIPLKVPYVPVTEDLIFRRARFRYRSVIYINEGSLLADSQLIKNMDLNDRLLLFHKLIGHETLGGYLIYDTQTISDMHYSVKRCISDYVYVHHLTKWIPFILVAHIQEETYSDDNSTVTVKADDVEKTLRLCIFSKRVWKKFDAYCYSVFTDDLPVCDDVTFYPDTLKANLIITFRERIKDGLKPPKEQKDEKKNN